MESFEKWSLYTVRGGTGYLQLIAFAWGFGDIYSGL